MSGAIFTTDRVGTRVDIFFGAVGWGSKIGHIDCAPEYADAFEAMVKSHRGVVEALDGLLTEVTDLLISPEHLRMILDVGGMNPTSDDAPEAFKAARTALALARPEGGG